MRKTYIFDTSSLISDPNCFHKFSDSDLILPITVLDELDKLKKQLNEAGKSARQVVRLLEDLSEKGDINTGLLLENNSLLTIDVADYPTKAGDALYGDTRILATALHYNTTREDVIFLTNDINFKIRARAFGIASASVNKGDNATGDLYNGLKIIEDEQAGSDLLALKELDAELYDFDLLPNQFILFLTKDGEEICVGKESNGFIRLVKDFYPWDLAAKNIEQSCAIAAIMDPKIPLVSVIGEAGTGKTLLSLACCLELVLAQKRYDRLMIFRPVSSVGAELGYMPGTYEDKKAGYFIAINDSFEKLFKFSNPQCDWRKELDLYIKKERIELEVITFARGRNLERVLILIDEGQNLSQSEMKTLLTRVSSNSKVVITGDVNQIDTKGADFFNNGITAVISAFKESHLSAHITLVEGQRGDLAAEAAKVL